MAHTDSFNPIHHERSSPDRDAVVQDAVDRLRRNGAGLNAPSVGTRFPDFALPDAQGRQQALSELLRSGPVVLSFNRGGWCPYCRRELARWARHGRELDGIGARLVTIVAEINGRSAPLIDVAGDRTVVLCDIDHGVALRSGLAFRCDEDLRIRYLECGLDLSAAYGSESWFLTIPATFAIDRRGVVRFAFVEPDFRLRARPEQVLAALASGERKPAGEPQASSPPISTVGCAASH